MPFQLLRWTKGQKCMRCNKGLGSALDSPSPSLLKAGSERPWQAGVVCKHFLHIEVASREGGRFPSQ